LPICVKFAATAEEIDGMFRARYHVFVDEEGSMAANDDGRIFDRYDAFPTTKHVIALVEERVIGGVRFTENSAAGTLAAEFFDFSPYLAADAHTFGCGGMLFVERAYRAAGLTSYLLGMGYSWALSRGWSHILGVVNPTACTLFLRNGYRALAEEAVDEQKHLAFVPVILDLRHLAPSYLRFVQDQQKEEVWIP
jgi:N-acyl-L-homoserine lactone synthetase